MDESKDAGTVSVGKALDQGWKLLSKDIKTWSILGLLLLLPGVLLSYLFLQMFDVDIYNFGSGTAATVDVNMGALILGQLLFGVYTLVMYSILLTTFIESAKGKEIGDFKNALKIGMPNLSKVIVATIVVAVLVVLGLFLLIIPGLIVAFLLGMTVYIVADTQKPVGEAMSLSTKYAQKFFGPILLAFLAAIGLSIVVSIVSVVFKPLPTILETFFSSVLSTGLQLFMSLSFAVLYLEMKKRFASTDA